MRQNPQLSLLIVEVGGNDIVIIVFGIKAVGFQNVLPQRQHVGAALTEGLSLQRLALGGIDGDEFAQIVKIFGLVCVYPGGNALFQIHVRSFLSARLRFFYPYYGKAFPSCQARPCERLKKEIVRLLCGAFAGCKGVKNMV